MRLGLAISNGSSGIRIVVEDFGLYTSNHIDPGPLDGDESRIFCRSSGAWLTEGIAVEVAQPTTAGELDETVVA
jgi:hypothetical protein